MDAATILTGSGAAGMVLAVAYGVRQILDWWQARDTAQSGDRTAAVTNAGTANALLLASLKDTQERETQLSGEVENLRIQNSRLYEQMRQQRKDHDAEMLAMRNEYGREIAELRRQNDEFSDRLADLQQRLGADDPDPPPST